VHTLPEQILNQEQLDVQDDRLTTSRILKSARLIMKRHYPDEAKLDQPLHPITGT
jgi:hypothetical protein